MNLVEVLGSVTDEIDYYTWAAQTMYIAQKMIPAGLEILGIFVYSDKEKYLKESIDLLPNLISVINEIGDLD